MWYKIIIVAAVVQNDIVKWYAVVVVVVKTIIKRSNVFCTCKRQLCVNVVCVQNW
jgi:hypothetical protein